MLPLVTIVTQVLSDTEAVRTLLPQIPATRDVEVVVDDVATIRGSRASWRPTAGRSFTGRQPGAHTG